MNVLVIQLCRMGDIVQTFPLLSRLTRQGHEVELLILESFRDLPIDRAASGNLSPKVHGGLVSKVHRFPTFDRGPQSIDELETRGAILHPLLESLRSKDFDLVLNLSYDEPSVLVANYVGAKAQRGLRIGDDRIRRVLDPWGQYLLSIPNNRHWGGFNLADIYIHMAGLPLEAPANSPKLGGAASARRTETRTQSLSETRTKTRPARVALVPGASDARKRWSAKNFATVAEALAGEGIEVVLLGSPDERAIAENICTRLSRASVTPGSDGLAKTSSGDNPSVRNLVGTTKLAGLSEALSETDLCITNDTGTMHLASWLGVRTLTVTLGPAHVFESGPYGEGHVSIEPELHCHPCEFGSNCFDTICHSRIQPDLVTTLALSMIAHRPLDTASVTEYSGCRIYESRFDSAGRLVVSPLSPYPIATRDLVRPIYQNVWESSLGAMTDVRSASEIASQLLNDWTIADGPSKTSSAVLQETLRLADSAESLASGLETGSTALLTLFQASEAGRHEALQPLLEALQRECDLVGELEPPLRPMTGFLAVQLSMAGARKASAVLTDLLSAVTSAANRARLFAGLVREVVEELESTVGQSSRRAVERPARGLGHDLANDPLQETNQ